MAKKTFLDRAQHSIAEGQSLLAEEPATATEMTKAEYEGTSRLKEARNIPIDKIRPDPNQPRTTFDAGALAELAGSIRENGILQPITVEYVAEEDYFKIITGERRFRAAQQAGLTHIPCIVRTVEPQKRLVHQLIENIQREDLSPIDKARGLLELKAALGKNAQWKVVEKITGISERRR
jgi:ParB family chromosome partitioning protein